MSNSQDFNGKRIDAIHTLSQLSSSLLVAKCIIEIREERASSLVSLAEENMPKLEINNQAIQTLYKDFCTVVGFKPAFVYLAKIGLEDMVRYNFKDDPSVVKGANQDTQHLQNAFGPNYAVLERTNLMSHTLNVFKQGLETGKKKGRIMQIALPILGCLFHDFGKSSAIRKELLGDQSTSKGYKAHAEVSAMYIRELLNTRFYNLTKTSPSDTIEMLANAVLKHHPASVREKGDNIIKFIIEADSSARKQEFKQLNQK